MVDVLAEMIGMNVVEVVPLCWLMVLAVVEALVLTLVVIGRVVLPRMFAVCVQLVVRRVDVSCEVVVRPVLDCALWLAFEEVVGGLIELSGACC